MYNSIITLYISSDLYVIFAVFSKLLQGLAGLKHINYGNLNRKLNEYNCIFFFNKLGFC